MLATIDWAKDGNPSAFANVARAIGGKEEAGSIAVAYEDLVRRSGIKVSFTGDGLDLARPECVEQCCLVGIFAGCRQCARVISLQISRRSSGS
jgi:hypothetical protein